MPAFNSQLRLELTPLGSTKALQLLQFNLNDHDLINSRTNTASILSSIGCSPLAIVLAAAYINRHMLSLEQYQTLLADNAWYADYLHTDNAWHADCLHTGSEIHHLAAVMFLSLTTICQSDDIATDCLLALACTSGLEIHREHLFVDESQDTNDAIATLEAYGLITTQSCNLVIDTVGPLCLILRLWLSNLGLKEDWITAAIAVLRRILPVQEYEDGSASTETAALWRRYLPHLAFALQNRSVASCIAANGMSWNELENLWFFGLRNYADRAGDSTDTTRHLQRVVELCRVESRDVNYQR